MSKLTKELILEAVNRLEKQAIPKAKLGFLINIETGERTIVNIDDYLTNKKL